MREEEEVFVRTFVRREDRKRWLQLLSSSRSRSKITQRLYDGPPGDFDPRLVQEIPHIDADGLTQQLARLGAPHDCWIISAHPAREPHEHVVGRHLESEPPAT